MITVHITNSSAKPKTGFTINPEQSHLYAPTKALYVSVVKDRGVTYQRQLEERYKSGDFKFMDDLRALFIEAELNGPLLVFNKPNRPWIARGFKGFLDVVGEAMCHLAKSHIENMKKAKELQKLHANGGIDPNQPARPVPVTEAEPNNYVLSTEIRTDKGITSLRSLIGVDFKVKTPLGLKEATVVVNGFQNVDEIRLTQGRLGVSKGSKLLVLKSRNELMAVQFKDLELELISEGLERRWMPVHSEQNVQIDEGCVVRVPPEVAYAVVQSVESIGLAQPVAKVLVKDSCDFFTGDGLLLTATGAL